MKKTFLISFVCVLCILTGILFAACDNTPTYTLTLYDGEEVYKTISVKEGELPEKPEDPTKDGYGFSGWFVTPTSQKQFDWSQTLTEDKAAYAQWKDLNYQDDRDWVISGTMNNWGADLTDSHLTKKSGTGNVYEITLDMYVGDEFQLTVLLSDGTLAYSSEGARAAFSHVVDGKDYVEGAGGLGAYKNITVKQDGNYTLSLVSAAETDQNELTIIRNGDVQNEQEEHEVATYAIKGNKVTGWADSTDEQYLMSKGSDGKYTLTIQLYANDEFMFVAYENADGVLSALTQYIKSDVLAEGSCTQVAAKEGGNFTTSANGTYTFTYDPEANQVSVEYSSEFSLEVAERPTTWYILGNGSTAGSVLATSAWGLNDESAQKLADNGSGVYQITLNLYEGDEFQICSSGSWSDKHGYDSLVDPGTNFEKGGNITVKVSGNYTLTLTIDADDETKDKIEWVRNGDAS